MNRSRPLATLSLVTVVTALAMAGEVASQSANPPEPSFTCRDAEHVVVQVVMEPLPADSTRLRDLLWDTYINGHLCGEFKCRVWDAPELWPEFVEALVEKAQAAGLDGASLEHCLGLVERDQGRNAYLPISASLATLDDSPVWVILVKWEWRDSSSREVLGHARVYVLDARSGRQVFFTTCS